jgi:hypothetical protein
MVLHQLDLFDENITDRIPDNDTLVNNQVELILINKVLINVLNPSKIS